MSNTAEGFERGHIREKLQFYNVARGSTAEVRSLLYVIEDNCPGCASTSVELREQTMQTGKLISGLIQSTERRRPGRIVTSTMLGYDEFSRCFFNRLLVERARLTRCLATSFLASLDSHGG
jgi:hypothetical protein